MERKKALKQAVDMCITYGNDVTQAIVTGHLATTLFDAYGRANSVSLEANIDTMDRLVMHYTLAQGMSRMDVVEAQMALIAIEEPGHDHPDPTPVCQCRHLKVA